MCYNFLPFESKEYLLFEIDEDDILVGSPKSKFFDMVFHANKNIIKDKIDSTIQEYVAMELLLSELLGEEYLYKIKEMIQNNNEAIDSGKNDFFINFVHETLSEHE